MTPPISSLNVERARVDALGAPSSAADSGAAGGAFADLLRGMGAAKPQASQPVSAAPAPAPAREPRAAEHGSKADQAAPHSPSTRAAADDGTPPSTDGRERARQVALDKANARRAGDAPKARATDREASATNESVTKDTADNTAAAAAAAASAAPPPTTDTAPTLAHWLLGQAAVARGAAAGDALPPPAQPAAASDDVDAAALTRDLLQGLRGGHGKAGFGPADARAAQGHDGPEPGAKAAAWDHARTLQADASGAAGAAAALDAAGRVEPAAERRGDRPGADALAGLLPTGVAPAQSGAFDSLSASQPAAVEQAIHTPVGAPGFGDEVTVSIVQLARDGVHEARLQLNPAELGPVAVRIEVADGMAHIGMGAAHEATRQLLEATLPALADALRADGLTLASTQVDGWSAGGSSAGFDSGASGGGGRGGARAEAMGLPGAYGGLVGAPSGAATTSGGSDSLWSGAARRGLGGLDLYA